MIKAVILDFDGTLAVLNIDFSVIKEEIFSLIEKYDVARESLREKYLLEIIDEAYSILLKRERHLAEQFREKAQRILVEKELEAASKTRLLPGVESMLRKLKAAGLKVGIVTRNCDRAVRRVFPHIESLCDIFLSRDSVKMVKPDPHHLATLLDRLGVSVRHAIMVGDHPMDILAGRRVGMRTAGVLTGRNTEDELMERGADYILKSASQLTRLVKRLNR
ncbi:MAG: HAD family hydrolase [Syntrophobacterales bacterium]|nr:MAG: HAD family hydrolase [Syntrophobacterales bacterium]